MKSQLVEIKNSFKSIKTSPIIIKILLLLLFSSFTITTFIFATTNSLANPKISALLNPIHLYLIAILICSGVILLMYFIFQKRLVDYLIVGSVLLFSIAFCLQLYAFSPCLFQHTISFEDHIHPHANSYILKQSFLCPSYSFSSRFNLLIFMGVGFITFLISMSFKRKKLD